MPTQAHMTKMHYGYGQATHSQKCFICDGEAAAEVEAHQVVTGMTHTLKRLVREKETSAQ